jgi:hypothetical protein
MLIHFALFLLLVCFPVNGLCNLTEEWCNHGKFYYLLVIYYQIFKNFSILYDSRSRSYVIVLQSKKKIFFKILGVDKVTNSKEKSAGR